MTAVGIIPARFGSTRFPGKPLAEILGIPMIQRVWEGAREAKRLREVIIATDDARIAACCEKFGAPVAMTSSNHPTGTDRLAEAARTLEDDVIVNIQGDEPLIASFVIDAAVSALEEDESVSMSTVVHEAEAESVTDPNRVKVVIDQNQHALYFSRSPIPYRRAPGIAPAYWQHVGIYAYRSDFLQAFVALERSPLEESEELEQLRALEHGYGIRAAIIRDWQSVPVDVPEDLERVESILRRSAAR